MRKSDIFQVSFNQESQSLRKLDDDRILKAIKNKMTPLNMSPKTKYIHERQLQNLKKQKLKKQSSQQEQSPRQTFNNSLHNKFSSKQPKKVIMPQKENFYKQTITPEQPKMTIDYSKLHRNIKMSIQNIKLKKNEIAQVVPNQENQLSQMQHMRQQRLPMIMQDFQIKKREFVSHAQKDLMQFQRDSLLINSLEESRPYNLEYVVNRLNLMKKMSKKKSFDRNQSIQPLKGYENMSPNKLKQYIKFFEKKNKKQPLSIYVSKKRIAMPKNITEGDDLQADQEKRIQTKPLLNRPRLARCSKKQSKNSSKFKSFSNKNQERKKPHEVGNYHTSNTQNFVLKKSTGKLVQENTKQTLQINDQFKNSDNLQYAEPVSHLNEKFRLKSHHKKLISHKSSKNCFRININ